MTYHLRLDKTVYSLEAVQKAAYRFIDRLVIVISQDEQQLLCDIDSVEGIDKSFEEILARFKQELLDQQLRRQIKEETESVRNLILSFAFSRSGLQG